MTSTTATTAEALAERLFAAGLGALELLNVELGSRLGLYHHLHDHGPTTAAELAVVGGIHERYAREWLEQQAVAGILDVHDPNASPAERRFALRPGHDEVLLDEDSEAYMAAFAAFIPVAAGALDAVADAFRTGGGVPYADYGIHDIQAAWTRPAFVHHLTQTWLPALPAIPAKLETGDARVCEIGCGEGVAAIRIALAYPGVHVDGIDIAMRPRWPPPAPPQQTPASTTGFASTSPTLPASGSTASTTSCSASRCSTTPPTPLASSPPCDGSAHPTVPSSSSTSAPRPLHPPRRRDGTTLLRVQHPALPPRRHDRTRIRRNGYRHPPVHRGTVRPVRRLRKRRPPPRRPPAVPPLPPRRLNRRLRRREPRRANRSRTASSFKSTRTYWSAPGTPPWGCG